MAIKQAINGNPAVYNATPPTFTDGESAALQIDADGNLKTTATLDAEGLEIAAATEYTEDAAAAANPVGGALILVREDGRAGSLTSADGDNVAARGNDKGELYVKTTDSDALLTTIDEDTNAIKTAVEVIDNAIAGTEMQVDVVASLPAGTNAIGKLAANSGVDIGDVDILSIAAGNNNIGDVDVASIAAGDNNIGNVDIASAIPAGTNLIGKISASNETSTVYNGSTALTPKFAVIDAASSGNNTLVAAVADKKIRVLSLYLVSAGTVTTRFESGADGTALTGQSSLVANTGFVLPYNPVGWFETGVNTLLNLELSAAVSVDGSLCYIEV